MKRGKAPIGWGVAAILAVAIAPAALALQGTGTANPPAAAGKKEIELPPDIAKMPFEIRDGYRKFMQHCTKCHDTKRVEAARTRSLFDLQGVIGTMAFKPNANIPQDDRQSIFVYLAYLQGTGGKTEEKDQYLSFLTKCEDCHGIGLVYKDKKPLKDWPEIIRRMARKSQAKISPEEEVKIMGYIKRMHPDLFGID